MKKILIWLIPLMCLIALCLFLFNGIEEYDFFIQLDKISKLDFPNPIDEFWKVIDAFKKWGDLGWNTTEVLSSGNAWNDFWSNVGQWFQDTANNLGGYFTLLFQILIAPVLLVYDLVIDIAKGGQAILTLLGLF